MKRAYIQEIGRLRPRPRLHESQRSDAALSWLPVELTQQCEGGLSKKLHTLCSMGQELSALWEARAATRDQLLRQLQDWCRRAEASEIAPLQRFSRELRRYG